MSDKLFDKLRDITPEARARFRDRFLRDLAFKTVVDPELRAKMDRSIAATMARKAVIDWLGRQAWAKLEGAR